jgi:hypothetical protein
MIQFSVFASLLSLSAAILTSQKGESTTNSAGWIHPPVVSPLSADQAATTTFHNWKNLMGKIEDYVKSILSRLGPNRSSAVGNKIPNIFQGFPVGSQIIQAVDASDEELAELPVHVLNLP